MVTGKKYDWGWPFAGLVPDVGGNRRKGSNFFAL
jgi:hypothetical protein